jgi:signal transduction histidine kinase
MQRAPLALIIHDLKNALGALEGQLDTLARHPTEAGALQAHARCVELRQQFVQYLTLYGTSQDLAPQYEDESPQSLLERLVKGESLHLPEGDGTGPEPGLALGHCEDAPLFWYFDPRLVRMALDAALHNARRFARSRIELSARAEGGYLVFSVKDDGPGLGAKDPSELSTGLGTSLCNGVAEAHKNASRQGHTTLANHPEGGACFELWLP